MTHPQGEEEELRDDHVLEVKELVVGPERKKNLKINPVLAPFQGWCVLSERPASQSMNDWVCLKSWGCKVRKT